MLDAASAARHGTPLFFDEIPEPIQDDSIQPGDVGISIHIGNARRGYRIGQPREQAERSSYLAVADGEPFPLVTVS